MSFDLKSLELFVRVAALGALGRAGEEMNLSPTATTQRIQALESALGTKLLNRTTRAISLTTDGETFLSHAQQILDCVESAQASMSSSQQHVTGELRVTASASFGRSQIVPHVGEFLRLYPDISLKLDLNDSMTDIVERGYDLAIRIGSLVPSSLLARKLSPNRRMLVASPGYLERAGIPNSPGDLKNHSCIVLGESRNWSLADGSGNITDIRVAGSFTTNFGEAITDALLQDLGIGLKSVWDISEHLVTGRLVPILPDYTALPEWQIWAVRPPTRVMPLRARAFIEFFEEKFKTALNRG
ncbi:LysR family transcriptional regulator [Tritonibacter mobilis]|uniref:LysR family transcriptional regulator n=1 Tax=Tritonibacter mobilis F1926 TaxID=1265309 RepID=A0A1B1A772_9RHOB|nr:LysR family transcriptional regulator [Tritonibacter mobilis]ANP42387.1 LysR family transcriptional regulator [Tritonibacter mobilis F1926]KJZ22689.1 LysR family transcriptional regulator [Tritonibacter mobilis]